MPKPWLFITILVIFVVALLKTVMIAEDIRKGKKEGVMKDSKIVIFLLVIMVIMLIYYLVPILRSL